MKKIVLAYSGGLDTSIILRWLQENYKAEIIAYTSDIGQDMDENKIIKNAKRLGVKKIIIENLKNTFVKDYVFPMIRAHAVYEGVYLLGTSIARPLIAKRQIEIAKKYGAEVPFLRDKKLSNDFTPTFKVLIDVVKKIGSQKEKFHFCIYPTSILISKNDLKMALLKIKKTKSKYIFPIAEFESNPYRSFIIKNNFIKFTWPKYQLKRSQDLDSLYYDTGSFYIYETKALLTISEKEIKIGCEIILRNLDKL